MKTMRTRITALTLAVLTMATAARAELALMMVEQPGCAYCERWQAEIGPIYPKTAEGRVAPLIHQDIRDALPEGVSLRSKPRFTPTFVLLQDGVEISRLEGYPGEDFFWGLLSRMLAPLPEWLNQTDRATVGG
jgi:hypothetical protein